MDDRSIRWKNIVDQYERSSSSAINEAETRLLLVDRILNEVLGWSLEAFHPEDYVPPLTSDGEKMWIDYHLVARKHVKVVVECKKVGTTFEFSAVKRNRKYKLSSLRRNYGKALSGAIGQAIGYCQRTGTYTFIVTNGVQWIGSIASWPNIEPKKFSAIVFHDLDDIACHLEQFVDFFSPEGVASQRIRDYALGEQVVQPAFAGKLNQSVPYNPTRGDDKNYLARPMESIMKLCFDELTGQERGELLQHCYVSSDASEGYFSRLDVFVGKTLPHYLEGVSGSLDRSMFERRPGEDSFGKKISLNGEAVLLVGKVGSGKTTFINYALQRLRKKYHGKHWVVLHLDLLEKTQIRSKVFDHDKLIGDLCKELLVQAEEYYPKLDPFRHDCLKGIFSADIQRAIKSLSPKAKEEGGTDDATAAVVAQGRADPVDHLYQYLVYLRANRECSVTVILDNIDRGTTEFEEVVFSFARRLSRKTGTTTVTAMRDTTYQEARRGGFLDVTQNTVFPVQPPAFASVASKRFQYVQTRLNSDSQLMAKIRPHLGQYPIDRVMDFADVLSMIVLNDSREIKEAIQDLAGTNVREALGLLSLFCTSKYIDIEKLMAPYRTKVRTGPRPRVPLDLFVKAVMRGGHMRFVETDDSPIVNLFQVNEHQVVSHFTCVRILQALRFAAEQTRENTDVALSELCEAISASAGNTYDRVLNSTCFLGRKGLVASRDEPEPPWNSSVSVRITAAGMYYLEQLIFNREYLRTVCDDMVVYDPRTLQSIEWIHRDRDKAWYEREDDKVKTLIAYLYDREMTELNKAGPARNRPVWMFTVMKSIAQKTYGTAFAQTLSARR